MEVPLVAEAIGLIGHRSRGLLGLDVRMTLDQGSYAMCGFASAAYTNLVRALLPAAYRLANLRFEARVVATNKATYVPYRGPWEVETWVRERLLDVVARALGIDPGRRRAAARVGTSTSGSPTTWSPRRCPEPGGGDLGPPCRPAGRSWASGELRRRMLDVAGRLLEIAPSDLAWNADSGLRRRESGPGGHRGLRLG